MAPETTTQNKKNEYRNDSGGVTGVVTIQNGKERAIAVKPGETIWLSHEEQVATANAPKKDEDNPLVNGTLVLVTPATEIANRRPLGEQELPKQPAPAPAPDPEKAAAAKAAAAKKKAEETQKKVEQGKKQAEQGVKPVEGETGAAVQPKGLPHQGQRTSGEEVATPEAPAKA